MIKHIVFWRLKEFAHGNDKATNRGLVKEKIEGLRGRIPGLLSIEVGLDLSQGDSSSDVALYSEFADRAALAAYLSHPAHVEVAAFVAAAAQERRMVDYEAAGAARPAP